MQINTAAQSVSRHITMMSCPEPQVETDPAAILLHGDGTVCDCNTHAEMLFGFRLDELVGRHISLLFPEMSGVEMYQEGRPSHQLSFRSRLGRPFEAIRRNGSRFRLNIFLSDLGDAEACRVRLVARPVSG